VRDIDILRKPQARSYRYSRSGALTSGYSSAMARVLSRQEAAATAKRLKDEGKALVFANGAFDLLHAGREISCWSPSTPILPCGR
jgi:hypothetical protein